MPLAFHLLITSECALSYNKMLLHYNNVTILHLHVPACDMVLCAYIEAVINACRVQRDCTVEYIISPWIHPVPEISQLSSIYVESINQKDVCCLSLWQSTNEYQIDDRDFIKLIKVLILIPFKIID